MFYNEAQSFNNPCARDFHCSFEKMSVPEAPGAVLRILSVILELEVFGISLRPYMAAFTYWPSLSIMKELVADPSRKCAVSRALSLIGLGEGLTWSRNRS